jgi:hypothetical protein
VPAPSRNDIRESAIRFARSWHEESRERGEAQTFWTEFLQIFGIERRRVHAAFERHTGRTSTGRGGFIDLLWPGMLLAEHKSRGASLDAAMDQALDYVDGLPAKDLPQLLIVSDFARMRILDLDGDDRLSHEFDLLDLPREIDRLLFLAGYRSRDFDPNEPSANIKAAELLARVYDEIETTGFDPHALRVFMVRVLFLLFADDTGIWERNQLADLLANRTAEDGSDLGMWLGRLFTVLDTDEADRTSVLDEELAAFPYVNGSLFAEPLPAPDTTRTMRTRLLEATTFRWSAISPAVFGSIFQSVMDPNSRRALGAHYTDENNILKLIRPLFLDALESELEACGSSARRLRGFHEKLGRLTFFDPACGCGNFLVIAYRELRRLEQEVLIRLHPEAQMTTDLTEWRKVSLTQFFGIEVEEFPARIAQTAMYLVDHLANEDLGRKFGVSFAELPLTSGATIRVGNALTTDWAGVLPPERCSYILGNPPYVGKHLLTADQKEDLTVALGPRAPNGQLDYVAGWFVKAAEYLRRNPEVAGAFVATNSITQGEQVPRLWPPLHDLGLHVGFAWSTFNWTSKARGAAHVHVVIVGFRHLGAAPAATLFEFDPESGATLAKGAQALNGYLIPGKEVYPEASSRPLAAAIPPVVYGAKPADGGHLLLTAAEAEAIRAADPVAAGYIRPMLSATEFLNGEERFCLWLAEAKPVDLRASSILHDRLAAVRSFREASKKQKTRELAATPALFAEPRRPESGFIFIPRHASAARRLIPMGLVPAEQRAVVHDSGAYIEDASLELLGLLQSEMFAAWQRTVGGRIKSDYRFNNRLVYNTFPFPLLSPSQRRGVAAAAEAVLAVRREYPESSLADLYGPNSGPAALLSAHRTLDARVDGAFGRRKRLPESERLSLLFERYDRLVRPGEELKQER